ncbi:hypothetical protein E2320_016075, partial [Naja naja]
MMMLLVLQQCMKILILPVYVLAYFGLWDSICKKTFPYFMKYFTKIYNKIMHKLKEMLFKNMQDFADLSEKLHLLEIGVGSGTNFQFYPPNSHVTCVEYNPNFQNIVLENMAESIWTYFWQQLCNPTWRYVTDGCSLLKETWKELGNAGFSKLNLQHLMG